MVATISQITDVAAWKQAVAAFDKRFQAATEPARRNEPPELDRERDRLSVWLTNVSHEEQIKRFCEIVPITSDGHLLMRMLIVITSPTPRARGLTMYLNSLIGFRLVRRAEMMDLHGDRWMGIAGDDPYGHSFFKDAMLAAAIVSRAEAETR